MTVRWRGPSWLRAPAESVGLGMLYMRVTDLDLRGPNYDDRVVEPVLQLRYLESLSVADTRLSNQALARVQRALPDCQVQRQP